MVKVEYRKLNDYSLDLNSELLKNKRNLTQAEIEILKKNNNTNKDSEWKNIFVDSQEGAFNPELIQFSSFEGLILLGKMQDVTLSYNDLHLTCGIYNSYVKNSFLGDYVCIKEAMRSYEGKSPVSMEEIEAVEEEQKKKFQEFEKSEKEKNL